MEVKNGFLEQVAKDYDMSYDEVSHIYTLHPIDFYEELETFIKVRQNQEN